MQDEGRSKLKEREKQKQLLAWFTYERMRLSTTYDDRLGGFKSGPSLPIFLKSGPFLRYFDF